MVQILKAKQMRMLLYYIVLHKKDNLHVVEYLILHNNLKFTNNKPPQD